MDGYGSTSIRATHPASSLSSPAQVNMPRQKVRTCGFAALGGTDKPTVVMLLNSLSTGLVCAEIKLKWTGTTRPKSYLATPSNVPRVDPGPLEALPLHSRLHQVQEARTSPAPDYLLLPLGLG